MKKLEDIVLNKGDIVEFANGNTMFIDGYAGYTPSQLTLYGYGVVKQIKRPIQYKFIYEAPQPILDKEEKEYLENVIRPFKRKVKYIVKLKHCVKMLEWIHVDFGGDGIRLPYFEVNTMYKDMEVDKHYTLEELGLFE